MFSRKCAFYRFFAIAFRILSPVTESSLIINGAPSQLKSINYRSGRQAPAEFRETPVFVRRIIWARTMTSAFHRGLFPGSVLFADRQSVNDFMIRVQGVSDGHLGWRTSHRPRS